MNLKVDVSPRSEGILEAVFNSVSIGGTLALPSVRVNAEKRLTGLCLWEWRSLWAEKKPQRTGSSGSVEKRLCGRFGGRQMTDGERLKRTREQIEFAAADTVCFFAPYPAALTKLQQENGSPLLIRSMRPAAIFVLQRALKSGRYRTGQKPFWNKG